MAFTLLSKLVEGGGGFLKSIFDAKGDLLVGESANTPVILTIGANNFLLVPDSSTSTGWKFIAALPSIDSTAVHVDVGDEITPISEKTTLAPADRFILEDSEDGDEKGFWKLDDKLETTDVIDSSSDGHDGTLEGGANTTDISVPGKVDKAFDMDGANDCVNVDDLITGTPNVAADTIGTIAIHAKPTNTSATRFMFAFGDTDGNEQIQLRMNSGGVLRAALTIAGVGQWRLVTDAAAFSAGVNKHIIVEHNGTQAQLFVDGVAPAQSFILGDATTKAKWIAAATGLDTARIGCVNFNSSGNINLWLGELDDCRYYSRLLTSGEKSTLSAGTSSPIGGNNDKRSGQLQEVLKLFPTLAYTRNATIVEDRTLLASASATTLNNNNVLAALIADLQTKGIL